MSDQSTLVEQTVIGDHNIFSGTGDVNITYALPPAAGEDRSNLLILLNKVRHFWVESVLEQSVHHAVLLELGKETRPQEVDHPWDMDLEVPGRGKPQRLTPNTKISDIFEQTGRLLLILGEPGSGKTITLLELARDLLKKAEHDPTQPIPVVFNLSSWAEKRTPLKKWLINEFKTKYHIPNKIALTWIDNLRILPLLDGLDEVKAEHRAACLDAINEFAQEGISGIVICSRLQEYLALPHHLKLNGAICLQPLTQSQIDNYLEHAGEGLEALHQLLKEDEGLRELSQSPLMLSIMVMAYYGIPTNEIQTQKIESLDVRRRQLFDLYVERMFKRKGKKKQPYPKEKIIKWLSWLATKMKEHGKTVFLVEEMQPSWLETKKQTVMYFSLSRFLLTIYLSIVILSLSITVVNNEIIFPKFENTIILFLTLITIIYLIYLMEVIVIIAAGIFSLYFGFLFFTKLIKFEIEFSLFSSFAILLAVAVFGLKNAFKSEKHFDIQTRFLHFYFSIKSVLIFLIGSSIAITKSLLLGTIYDITLYLLVSMLGNIVFVTIISIADNIHATRINYNIGIEKILYKKDEDQNQIIKFIFSGWRPAAIITCIFISADIIDYKMRMEGGFNHLFFNSNYLIAFHIFTDIVFIPYLGVIEIQQKNYLNHTSWVRLFIFNSFKLAALSSLLFYSLTFFSSKYIIADTVNELILILSMLVVKFYYAIPFLNLLLGITGSNLYLAIHVIIVSFAIGSFFYGISFVIKHYVLRLLLGITNIELFFKNTSYLLFTNQIGSGYVFIHRYLLEHFATLYEEAEQAKQKK